jgi:hypothetical protein
LNKSDAAKAFSGAARKLHAETFQHGHGLRHQAFSARFVNERPGAVGYDDAKTFLPGGNCGCQSGRASADDKYIGALL